MCYAQMIFTSIFISNISEILISYTFYLQNNLELSLFLFVFISSNYFGFILCEIFTNLTLMYA